LTQTTGINRRILKATDTLITPLIPTTIGGVFTDDTCDYNNDPTITHNDDSGKIKAGVRVYGEGIPDGAYVSSITSNTEFELSASTTGGSVTDGTLTLEYEAYTANKANKVYICNSSVSETDYIVITIDQEPIGRLYAGDWMFMPWSASNSLSSIYVTAATQTSTVIIDYMVISEGDSA